MMDVDAAAVQLSFTCEFCVLAIVGFVVALVGTAWFLMKWIRRRRPLGRT